jgi:hypothetical protein
MYAQFNHFELQMTKAQAQSASHPGPCDADVAYLAMSPNIRRQLNKSGPDAIRAELREYGAWDDDELADDAENRLRLVWIAAGNITDELQTVFVTKERGEE